MNMNIKELALSELQSIIESWGYKRFAASQVFSWMYKKGIEDFSEMSNLAVPLRAKLKERFYLSGASVAEKLVSRDGTQKILFRLKDGNYIESALIPAEGRVTGCVSSQAGCKYACVFCASGLAGFKRDLSCGEIIDEVFLLKKNSPGHKLTHLVFMGTGEPLDNYDNVLKAIRIINSPESFHIGARRITISTSGLIPGIKRLSGEGLQIELSVSLHAADDSVRTKIMPVNKKYPLKDLRGACKDYINKTNRQITFEYVLIKGVNDDLRSAEKLCTLIRGLNAKVNLILSNNVPECGFEPPDKKTAAAFKNRLAANGIQVTVRASRGEDIQAACGQLRLRHEQK